MSDENRFFRFVWRFNGIVLALLCIAGLYGVGSEFVGRFLWRQPDFAEPVGHFAPVPKVAEKNFTYRLTGSGQQYVIGHEEVFSLTRWEGEPREYGLADIGSSYRSGPDTQEVNLLAVDADNSTSHWLFHGYDRMILIDAPLYEAWPSAAGMSDPTIIRAPGTFGAPAMNAPSAFALVLETVDADTDRDNKITAKDKHSLYVYRKGATEAVKIMTADDFLSIQQIGSDKYLVVSEDGKTATATTFSLPDFQLLSQKPLPSVPK